MSERRDLSKEVMSVIQPVKHFPQKQLQCMEQCRQQGKPGIAVAEPGTCFHILPSSLTLATQGQISGQKGIFEKHFLPWGFFDQELDGGFPWQRLPTAAWEWDWFLLGTLCSRCSSLLLVPGPDLWTDFFTSGLMSYYLFRVAQPGVYGGTLQQPSST